MKSLSLTAALLALPTFAAIGPSFEVPVNAPTIARAPGTQKLPLVATDGRDFFAVWIDSRGGTASVFGTRVLADGTVLDPTGILIASPGVECLAPGLVWDGANYVVVWEERGSVPNFFIRASFARVDRSGTVLGGPKALVDSSSGDPLIASNGLGSVVIFSSRSGPVIRIDQDGSLSTRHTLVTGVPPLIASNGDGYLLSWSGLPTWLLRLDNNGDVVAGSLQQFSGGVYTQLTATIGGPYLLVGGKWGPDFSSCGRSIEGRLVTGSTVSSPFVIHDAGGADIASFAATPDGNGFQVVWLKRLGTYQCAPILETDPPGSFGPYAPFGVAQIHVGADGSSGAAVTVSEGSGTDAEASGAGSGAAQLLVWIESTAFPTKLAAAIAHPGQAPVPIPIASSAAMQDRSSIAAAGSSFMAVWSEENPSDESTASYARRFTTDGRPLDAAAMKVADGDSAAVFSDGAVWLFLWRASFSLLARRMAADGTWIDAAPFPIGPADGSFTIAVASNGNGFAVLNFKSGPSMSLTFIPRSGEMHAVPGAVTGLTSYQTPPSMAWDGSAYVVVWRDGYGDYIEGLRLGPEGQVVTPPFIIHKTSQFDDRPSIACRDGACTVAWLSDYSIAAASIIGSTVIPITARIAATSPNTFADAPMVLATRDGFQLFWSERGSATPSLFTASVTAAGFGSPSILGPGGSYGAPVAAVAPNGQMALTLIRAANDPAYGGVTRAFLRFWPGERRRAAGR